MANLAASFEEFQKDPKAYAVERGMRPAGLRNNIIMPTNVQVSLRDFGLGLATHEEFQAGERVVDIMRRIDFRRSYRGRLGRKDVDRQTSWLSSPANRQQKFNETVDQVLV